MEHLTEDGLAALLRDPRATGARELVDHLAKGCDTCEAFLEAHHALDGEVDRALLALRPSARAEPELDELSWARLRRALKPSRAVWIAIPLAAALAIAFLIPRLQAPDDGLKGSGAPLVLELSAAVKQADGTLARIDDGARVKPDGVLIFRYHVTQGADGSVWIQRGTAAPVKLGAVRLEPGTHELAAGPTLVGVSLEGEVGTVVVWVIAGKARTDQLDPVTAARAVDSRGDVAMGRVTVQVLP